MSVAAYILIALLPPAAAFVAYLWYLTPDPKDVAEQVLRSSKRKNGTLLHLAPRPQPDLTHINCLS